MYVVIASPQEPATRMLLNNKEEEDALSGRTADTASRLLPYGLPGVKLLKMR
jgi:hypothetical protein